MYNFVLFHSGKRLKEHFYDCLYQLCLTNPSVPKWVIMDDCFIDTVKEKIRDFDYSVFKDHLKVKSSIKIIPLSILETDKIKQFKKLLPMNTFRDGFWHHTLLRFFYIESFTLRTQMKNVVHLENDVMIYSDIMQFVDEDAKMIAVRDAPNRIIASVIFFKDVSFLSHFTNYVVNMYFCQSYFNDMKLLSNFFEFFNKDKQIKYYDPMIFDGAAIGQYLGGVDPENSTGKDTRGFINETAELKANEHTFKIETEMNAELKTTLKYFTINGRKINNLHIHSKNLKIFNGLNINESLLDF